MKKRLKIGIITMFCLLLLCGINVCAETYGSLRYEISNKEIHITGCDKDAEGEIVIPDEINGMRVEGIKYLAFKDCKNIESVVMSQYIGYIGEEAFSGCTGLKNVEFKDSYYTIGRYAFSECVNLDNIKLGKCKVLNEGAFQGCEKIKNIDLGEYLSEINDYAFENCKGLESINIPSRVSQIGQCLFVGCENLENIYLDNYYFYSENGNVYNKGDKSLVFYAPGKKDKSFVIPEEIKKIEDSAFESCTELEEVIIPEGVTEIRSFVFADCINLNNIEIADSVRFIGGGSFCNCKKLKSVRLPNKLDNIYYGLFQECTNLEEITIYGEIKGIGEYAFENCESLKTVNFYGTEEEWNKIKIENPNEPLKNVSFNYIPMYKVRYIGDYCDTEVVSEGENAVLPIPPDKYIYEFTVNGEIWDGKNITEDTTVTVTRFNKDCDIIRVISPYYYEYFKDEEYFATIVERTVDEVKIDVQVADGLTWKVYYDLDDEPLEDSTLRFDIDSNGNGVYIKVFNSDGSVKSVYPFSVWRLDEGKIINVDIEKKVSILGEYFNIEYNLFKNGPDLDGTFYIASYNESGQLINVYSRRIRRSEYIFSSTADLKMNGEERTLKFFFWGGENGMKPINTFNDEYILYPEQ